MCLRIAKVDQETISKQLGDVSVIALNHLGTGGLIRPDHLTIVFRVELAGEASGVHHVAEHNSQLPSFGFRGMRYGWWRFDLRGGLFLGSRLWGLGRLSRSLQGILRCTSPHQDAMLFVYSQLFSIDEFVFDALDIIIIDVETQFERSVGDSLFTLEQFEYLGEDVIEGHDGTSAWLASPC
jgi:hypothetical protein